MYYLLPTGIVIGFASIYLVLKLTKWLILRFRPRYYPKLIRDTKILVALIVLYKLAFLPRSPSPLLDIGMIMGAIVAAAVFLNQQQQPDNT